MNRKGSAIAVAVILGTVFFIAVSALLTHSSGEVKHVKAISAVKKAELLAMSGIDWAESELRVGRWYGEEFVPYEKHVGKHNSSGMEKLTPFGSGEGTVKVVCEDVANKIPGSNMHGMQQLWFLHHINVFALGEFENQQCLMYGRYIISPEPMLNSKSTDGADFASPEYGLQGAIAVPIREVTISGETVKDFVIKDIRKFSGDKVDVNTVLAILTPSNNPDKEIEFKPVTFGEVAEVRMSIGQTCSAGDNLMLLTKAIDNGDGTTSNMKTLKKMVRVTKIPPEIWKEKNLDIEDINDRFALSQYITGLSDSFLQNFVAHSSLEDSLKEIGDEKLDKKLSSAEVLEKFPADFSSTTRNRAENTFLAYMIKNFTAPGGTWDKKEKALNKTYLKLDAENKPVDPDYLNWLASLGYDSLVKTKPRSDTRLYDPDMKNNEFIELLEPHFNQPTEEFIKSLSELDDAARFINIQEGNYDDEPYKYDTMSNPMEIVDPGKGIKIDVTKETRKYTFVDPESNFAIEMADLLAFLKKYYDDESCLAPREEVRVNEFIDWPLPAPAPAPPAEIPGGNWVWIEGTPGTPPGAPKYHHSGGSETEVDPPTGGTGSYEPYYPGDDDGGEKKWKVPGGPGTDGGESGEKPDGKEDENEGNNTIKRCNCTGGCCCGICDPDATKEKIVMNTDTTWSATPSTPGVDCEQGHYVWEPAREEEDSGSDGEDGSDGSASGNSNSNDDASDETSGSGGTGGYGSGNPGGSSSGGSGSSAPSPSYRSGSFGC